MDQWPERRIVIIGKSGSGKSSLANTLHGEEGTFKESDSANSVTRICQSETRIINGRSIQLIDTPGFFDTDLKGEELKTEIYKCIVECAPGAHAFLLVFTVGRFTPQEQEVVNLVINDYFGEDALKFTTVVFTHGDDLTRGMKIEDWLKENKSLKNLVDKCGGRCCVIDNKNWNKNEEDPYRNNQNHIEQLLKTIDQTVRENKEGYYTNKMLQIVQKQVATTKSEIKQCFPNIAEEILKEKVKEVVVNLLKNNFNLNVARIGAIWGLFLGGAAGFALAQSFTYTSFVGKCVAVGGGVVVGAALGAVVGAKGGEMVSEYVLKPLTQKGHEYYKSE